MNAPRTLALANAALGAVVVAAPAAVARAVATPGGVPDFRVVRVLGARQCVQGLVTALAPTSDVLWLGSAVDLTHAATMAPLLATRFRRAALISAGVAVASALAARSAARSAVPVAGR